MRSRRMTIFGLLLVGGLALLAPACGDDDDDSDTSATAPEDLQVSDADVAVGLAEVETLVEEIVASVETDNDKALDLNDGLHETWESIEGTIKANDEDTYITFEDDFAALKNATEDNDAEKAESLATKIAATAKAYLDEYPG